VSDKEKTEELGVIVDHLMGELPMTGRESLQRRLADDQALAHEHDEVESLITQLRTLQSTPDQTPDLSGAILPRISSKKGLTPIWYRPALTPLRVGSLISAFAILMVVINLQTLTRESSLSTTRYSNSQLAEADAAYATRGGGYSAQANYNDDRVAESEDVILTYINGAFGTLVMIVSGSLSIVLAIAACNSSTRRRYLALSSLVFAIIAVGSFVLRSLANSWFNSSIMGL
jgi:uncharacterized membrane protein